MSADANDPHKNILTYLQMKGWDIENRLYLGFGPRRLAISVLAPGEEGADATTITAPRSMVGHKKTQQSLTGQTSHRGRGYFMRGVWTTCRRQEIHAKTLFGGYLFL